jgi:mRNA interferase RelE/StbE
MVSYRIEWKRSAVKELRKLPPDAVSRIIKTVEALAENPTPAGVKKLIGSHHTYRIREGTYRIVYNILSDIVLIEILRVGHRKDVYQER